MWPLVEIFIEPKSRTDQEKLCVALDKLVAEDPTLRVYSDQESGQTVLCGLDERHLEINVDNLRRLYKIDANIGQPQVAYRETIGLRTEIEYTHKS